MQRELKFQLPWAFCKQRPQLSRYIGCGALAELFFVVTGVRTATNTFLVILIYRALIELTTTLTLTERVPLILTFSDTGSQQTGGGNI